MTVGFVVWNPFQVFHMGPIAEHLDDVVFLVVNRWGLEELRAGFGGSVGAFIDRPHQIVTTRQLTALDGKLDALVCPNPFPGMNALAATRRVGIQYSMTKESYQYGTWRSQFDVNLAYGDYTVGKLLRYGPAVAVGNPRFAPWFKGADEPAPPSPRKTVIYLPTWGEFSSVPRFLPAIEALQADYEVIVKLHHKIHLTEPDKTAQLQSSGIKSSFLPHDDLLPQLRRADLVISDYSGAIFDAIYVRKPVLLLQEDPASLIGDKFTFDSIEYSRRDDIGPVVASPAQLADTVAAVLNGSIDYRDANERLRAECFAEDVHAAERCAEVIDTVAHQRTNPLSPRSHSNRPVVAPERPVEQRILRLEQQRAAGAGTSTPAGDAQEHLRARMRQSVRAAAGAAGAGTLLPALAAAPGPHGKTTRHLAVRTALRVSADPSVAIRSLEALQRRDRLDTGQRLWLADLLFVTGRGDEAARLVEGTTGTSAPDLLKTLARAYETLSGPAASWNTLTGLVSPAPVPASNNGLLASTPLSVDDILRRVTTNAASIATDCTEFETAAELYAELLKLDDDVADLHHGYGKALGGAFRLDEARQAYAEALRRGPFVDTYQRSYASSCSKAEDWEGAHHAWLRPRRDQVLDASAALGAVRRERTAFDTLDAAFTDPVVVSSPAFRDALEDSAAVAPLRPAEQWMALHWRLIRLGAFSAAYRVKDLAAWSLLGDLSRSNGNDPRSTVRLSRALVTVGEHDEARRLLSLWLAASTDEPEGRAAVTKALADLDLLQGETSSIVRWFAAAAVDRFPQDEGRRIARDVFEGRRVAIVGPGRPPEGASPDRFDAYDVVVRPNLFLDAATAAATGSERTDVAYFNSGITRLGLDDLLDVAAGQGVRQVVLRRPRDLGLLAPRLRSGKVRFVDIEPSCHLFASSFGIQRMLYDINLYRPRTIDVFNVDFFAGAVEYVDGYKIDNADISFRGYTHDFRGDFILSRNLRASGAVGFDPVADAILDLDVAAYLELLDAKPSE